MGILEDVLRALERIPAWKRLQSAPQEIDQLKARVAALELRLAPATGDSCPKCRVMTFMLQRTVPEPGPFGDLGAMQDEYLCSSCGYTKVHKRNPG